LRILIQGLVLLEEPMSLDILQLMIPLMAFFPLALWGLLRRPNLTLLASVALYAAARHFDWNLPIYPYGVWSFNPFCWQLMMVLGGWFAVSGVPGGDLRGMSLRDTSWARALAGAYLLFALVITLAQHSQAVASLLPDALLNAFPANDKENLPPYRIAHFLALAFLATHLVPASHPALQSPALQPVIRSGEEWLAVFCIGVFLSLAAHVILITGPNLVLMQVAVTLLGFAAMAAVAYYVSWSKRQDHPVAARPRQAA
jgi:hypothetical protein